MADEWSSWSSTHTRIRIEMVVTAVFLFVFARLDPKTIPWFDVPLEDDPAQLGMITGGLAGLLIFFLASFLVRSRIEAKKRVGIENYAKAVLEKQNELQSNLRKWSPGTFHDSEGVSYDPTAVLQNFDTTTPALHQQDADLKEQLVDTMKQVDEVVRTANDSDVEGLQVQAFHLQENMGRLATALEDQASQLAKYNKFLVEFGHHLASTGNQQQGAARRIEVAAKELQSHVTTEWKRVLSAGAKVRSFEGTEMHVLSFWSPLVLSLFLLFCSAGPALQGVSFWVGETAPVCLQDLQSCFWGPTPARSATETQPAL